MGAATSNDAATVSVVATASLRFGFLLKIDRLPNSSTNTFRES
jgi:hypothetical protein